MLYTGADTMTAGRIAQAKEYVAGGPFMLTYGDGVADVDVGALLAAHEKSGAAVTLTAARPEGRFGALEIREDGAISQFQEKPADSWINGGFFVCENEAFDYIPADSGRVMWEREPLQNLAKDGRLFAYRHFGFWHPMDTPKDKADLNALWSAGKAPWNLWGHFEEQELRS